MKKIIKTILPDFILCFIGLKQKHHYILLNDRLRCSGRSFPLYKCIKCGNVVSLESWQINDLPGDMKYCKDER